MIIPSGLKYTLQISTTQNLKKYLKNQYQELNFHIIDVPNGIIRVSFQYLKQNLISNNTSKNTYSVNFSSTIIDDNHELNAPQYS